MVFGKHIRRYYLRYAPMLLMGLAALALVDYLQLFIPNLYQMLINGVNDGKVVTAAGETVPFDMAFLLNRICMPMVGVILAMVAGRFLWRVMFFSPAIRTEKDLRDRMFDRSRRLSPEYYQVNKVGSLMSLYTNDLDTVQECFAWGLMMTFDALLLGAMAIYKMMRMNVLLASLSMIPALLLLASSTVVGKIMSKKWDERQEAFSRLSDFSQESFSGIAVIKAFVKEAKELLAFKKLNVENEEKNVAMTRAEEFFRVMVTLFVESVICIILGYGGYLVHEGTFNAGQLVEFIGYFTAIVWPIMAVSELIDMTSRGRASMKRIGELLDAQPAMRDREGAEELRDPKGEIEFRGLTFSYPGSEREVLKDVSFVIRAGENVGLVGKTGCGKTTLVDLILRAYNVPDGTLFLDGKDVNTLTLQSVRAASAYVPQDNFLFSDTVFNNIAFSDAAAPEEAVREAARLSDVDGDISGFQNGYQTVLGERGVTVSGGQKQRISIARALMKNAPILILDDSVSAVDTGTEKTILENLAATRRGKTTILIAHRVSTIEKMDKILFLKDGSLQAVGTHEALYESEPEYRKMVDLQRLEEEGGDQNA